MFGIFKGKRQRELEAIFQRSRVDAMAKMATSRFAVPDPKEWMRFALTSYLNRSFNEDMDSDPITQHMHSLRHQLLLAIQAACYIVDYYESHGEAPTTSRVKHMILKMSERGGLNPWCEDEFSSSSRISIPRDDTVSLIYDLAWIAIEEFELLVRAVKAQWNEASNHSKKSRVSSDGPC